MNEAHAVDVEVLIAARPETVFGFFTDSESFGRWVGGHIGVATIDPRVGGEVRVHYPGPGVYAGGTVLALDAPRAFAFTWGYENGRPFAWGSTRVDVTLEAVAGGTRLRLRHSGLPDEVLARNHRMGWLLCTGLLGDHAARREHGAGLAAVVTAWFEAWAAGDSAARADALGRCLADAGEFQHASAWTRGRPDLATHIENSRRFMTGLVLESAGPFEQVHGHVRFPWRVRRGDEVVSTGVNVAAIAADGRFARVVGFTDPHSA